MHCNAEYTCSDPDTGSTILILAAWSGNANVVKWILSLGGDDDAFRQFVLHEGRLYKTSACRGVGPFSAIEWARRKSVVCVKDNRFQKIVKMLSPYQRAI